MKKLSKSVLCLLLTLCMAFACVTCASASSALPETCSVSSTADTLVVSAADSEKFTASAPLQEGDGDNYKPVILISLKNVAIALYESAKWVAVKLFDLIKDKLF